MKVNIGNDRLKRKPFMISLDSSTTSNFGEVQPIFATEVPPNSHIDLNIRDAVRFAPLSFPTFGKAFLKTYAFAHSLKDLYPPFDDFLARTPYTAVNGNVYTPTEIPSVPAYLLWLAVLSNCTFTFYSTNYTFIADHTGSDGTFTDVPLFYTPINDIHYSDGSTSISLNDASVSASLPLFLLNSLSGPSNTYVKKFSDPLGDTHSFISYLMNPNSRDKIFFDSCGTNIGCVYKPAAPDNSSHPDSYDIVSPQSADYLFPINSNMRKYLSWTVPGNNRITPKSTPDGSVLTFKHKGDDVVTIPNDIFVAIRLNDSGKFLRKIFMGLGLQIAPTNTPISLLPIYAYFKSYFEEFAPKRFVKFEQTFFARFMNTLVNTGLRAINLITSLDNDSYTDSLGFNNIIDDLLSCYYTKDTDYYSAQIIGLINDYGTIVSQPYMGEYYNSDTADILPLHYGVSGGDGAQASVNLSGESGLTVLHTQAQQNILSRLTQLLNRRSVLGGKIASFLSSTFGISTSAIENYNGFIGSSSLDVNFSDVFSTAETAEGSLGEYAGKALAFGDGDHFSFETKIHTLVLGLSVLIPRTQYVQGIQPFHTHVTPDSFYNPMFDGLTLLPTRKSSLYCGNGFFAFDDSKNSFGNLPIYSEYKTKTCGILNGDLSLKSTRDSYDSFTLDEIISPITTYSVDLNDPQSGTFQTLQYNPKYMVAGTMWRYLGRWVWLGRFDRIFVNNRLNYFDFINTLDSFRVVNIRSSRNLVRTDDNLIVHHVIDLKLNSAMVPLAGSFMTDDLLALDSNGLKSQVE